MRLSIAKSFVRSLRAEKYTYKEAVDYCTEVLLQDITHQELRTIIHLYYGKPNLFHKAPI